jgi:hypothetical protein
MTPIINGDSFLWGYGGCYEPGVMAVGIIGPGAGPDSAAMEISPP